MIKCNKYSRKPSFPRTRESSRTKKLIKVVVKNYKKENYSLDSRICRNDNAWSCFLKKICLGKCTKVTYIDGILLKLSRNQTIHQNKLFESVASIGIV